MTYVKPLHLAKYDNPAAFEPAEGPIYRRLADGRYVLALRLELEKGERAYLVIEDIMIEYRVSATGDTWVEANGDLAVLNLEVEGSEVEPEVNLANLRRMAATIGSRAHEVIVSPHEIKLVFQRPDESGEWVTLYERWVDSGLHKRILE
ncbi:MAG: hypothetical protein LBR33_12515 [Propionibacteriaceae bacterium]|jgi:hypothetical protein|nr:hypothetical protein [Propionibacteriaceae bacterium]